VSIDPEFLEAHINLGGVLARMGRIGEARKSFRKALDVDPGNEIAARNLARLE
jgi:Flp pilus assembly protein TadD